MVKINKNIGNVFNFQHFEYIWTLFLNQFTGNVGYCITRVTNLVFRVTVCASTTTLISDYVRIE